MKTLLALALITLFAAPFDLPKQMKKTYTYVPSGNVVLEGEEVSVQSFYMAKTEVTHAEYNQFLSWLKENGTEEEQQEARIRNENWVKRNYPQEKYGEHYHTHEAYLDYPVVNVSHKAAQMYCDWLTTKLNATIDGQNLKFRLPFRAEFIKAGSSSASTQEYAWNEGSLKDAKGVARANFVRVLQSQLTHDDEGNITVVPAEASDDPETGVDLMAPSQSYEAYSYGFHNLNGNVAEMVAEEGVAVGGSWNDLGYDIRLRSKATYGESACDVGFRPAFTVVKE